VARASPSGERGPPWQPTPSPLARIAEARSCDRRSSARPPKRHQPADRLIAASGVNQLRSISRDENGRPGHPRPALRGATSISCVTPRHLSCAAGRAPPPRTVRPAWPMQLQGLPSLAGPAARVATGRSRPAHTGVSPVLSPARLCRPPDRPAASITALTTAGSSPPGAESSPQIGLARDAHQG